MSKVKPERKILDDFASDFIKGKDEEPFWEFPADHGLSVDESKKIKLLKDRMDKLEEESTEKNRLINNQRKQLDDTLPRFGREGKENA